MNSVIVIMPSRSRSYLCRFSQKCFAAFARFVLLDKLSNCRSHSLALALKIIRFKINIGGYHLRFHRKIQNFLKTPLFTNEYSRHMGLMTQSIVRFFKSPFSESHFDLIKKSKKHSEAPLGRMVILRVAMNTSRLLPSSVPH